MHPYRYATRFPGCRIDPTAILYDNVTMGEGNVIGPFCVLGYPGAIREAERFDGEVWIGDGNTFGIGVTVCVGTGGATMIGHRNIIMNRVNVGHNVAIRDDTEIGAGAVIGGWASVLDGARIKLGALIRNRVSVGAGALVGMGANVVADVPAEARVKGNPARAY